MIKRPGHQESGARERCLMRRKTVFFLFWALVLPLGFWVTPALLRAETIKIAWPAAPGTLDPHRAKDAWSWTFIEACYQRLVEYQGDTAKLVPSAAVTWRISDDRLIYTFVLKKDQTFTDGRPLDAAAVSTSFNRAFHIGENFFTYFPALGSIEIIGPHTFRFHLSRPDPSFLPALATGSASIVSPNAALHPPEYLDRRSLGSGVYQATDDQTDGRLVLTRRRSGRSGDFWFLFEADADQRAVMLEEGRVHIAAGIRTNRLDRERFIQKTYNQPMAGYLAFNMDRPWIGQKEARRALAAAINRKDLAAKGGDPGLTPESGYLPAGMWGRLAETSAPAFDPEQAGQEMKKAGSPDQPLVLAFASKDDFQAEMARFIKEAIIGTGVAVVLKPMNLKEDGLPGGEYDLFFGIKRPAVIVPERFWDTVIGPTDNPCRYQNNGIDEKRAEASMLGISDKRLAVIYDIQRLLDQDLPYILLFTRRISYGVDKRLEGFDLHPLLPTTIPLRGLKLATPTN